MGSLPKLLNATEVEKCHSEFSKKDRILSTVSIGVYDIFSDVCQEYVALATKNTVMLFCGKSFDLVWRFQTDNPIGCISISEDSCLLFIAETHGMFYIYHIPTKSNIWKVKCPAEEVSSASLYKIIQTPKPSGYLSVFIIYTNWVVYEIGDVFIPNLYKVIKNGNISSAFQEVKIKKLNLSKSHPNYNIIQIFPVYLKEASLGILYETVERPFHPSKQSVRDSSSLSDSSGDFSKDICDVTLVTHTFSDTFLDDKTMLSEDISSEPDSISLEEFFFINNPHLTHAVKVVHSKDGKFLIALSDNAIHTLSAEEGIHCSTFASNYPIEDFVVKENFCDDSECSDHELGLKCRSISEDSHYIFEIRMLSSFSLLYQVDLSNFMQLIRCIPNQNFWSIISGDVIPKNSSESQVNNLVVSFFYPPSPDAILSSLIEEGKMCEAEELARKHNFSLEIIHKATIKNILTEFSREDSKTLSSGKVQEMWKNLNNSLGFIKDPSFIKSCVSCVLPDTGQEKKLLSCIQKWMLRADQSNDVLEMVSQVNELLKRITTYQSLFTSLDSCLNLKEFFSQNLLEFMISKLNDGNLGAAFVIWQKHKDEFIVKLNVDTIENVLQAIPSSTPSNILIPFLEVDFLPHVFFECPDSIKTVALWIRCRVYDFEIFEKTLWPENGLRLLKVTISIVNNLFSRLNEQKMNFSTAITCASQYKKPYCVGVLTEFKKYVTWIQTLKKDFNCIVQLSDFEEAKDVIFTILDQIEIKSLPTVIDKFARSFTLELDLDLDNCLEEYLIKSVDKVGPSWLSSEDDHLEERLVTIINNIASSVKWTNASLVLLPKVAVPWSQRVKELVHKALKRNHQRRSEFLLQSTLVGLKEMVRKYKMEVSTECLNEQFLSVFVKYIFKENRPSALEDAQKVLSTFGKEAKEAEVYFKYLQFSLNHNRIDDVLNCFSNISEENGIYCASRLLRYVQIILDDCVVQDIEELINNAQYIGVYLVKYLKKLKQPVDENLIIQFKCLEKLQEEFGLSLTLSEFQSESKSRAIIKTAIHKFITQEHELSEKSSKLPPGILQLYRLGHILSVKRETILGFLITDCLKEKKYEYVLILCNEIIDSCQFSDAAEALLKVIRHFYENFRRLTGTNFTVLVNTIQHLTAAAMTYISEGFLLENLPTLQLTMYTSRIKEITGKKPLVVNPKDPYNMWHFSPLFQDQGFQLDFDTVMRFLIAVFNMQGVSSCKDKHIKIKAFFTPSGDLLTHMNDSGHTIALLRTMYFIHSVLLPHTQDSEVLQFFSGLHSVMYASVFSVMKHVVSQRKVDLSFALQLVYLVPKEFQNSMLNDLLKWCSRDLNRLPYVASIGMQLAQTNQDTEGYGTFESIFKRAFFFNTHPSKLMSTELVLKPSPKPEHCWNLVKDLISSKKPDLSVVLGCCKAFRLKPEPFLMAYLKELLFRAENKCFQTANPKDHLSPAFREAETIIKLINNDEKVYNKLIQFLKEISPYSYEIYVFIKEQLHVLSESTQTCSSSFEMDRKLLKFLEVYKRISLPGEVEKEKCFVRPEDLNLSDISKIRLPYLYTLQENLHKVINPELRENTLKIWLEVAPLLKISADDMIIISIRNSVSSYLELLGSKHFVQNAEDSTIRAIEDMIAEIRNDENAVASAYWVSTMMPPGGNRVKFAHISVMCAEKWFKKDPSIEIAVTTYKNMKSIYQKYSIESVLFKYGLLDNQLLNLIQYPVQLIECLLEKFLLSDENNKVCETAVAVANIADIKLINIIFKYILNWLSVSPTTANNIDETFLENFESKTDTDYDLDCENLKRIINLLMCISVSLYEDLQREVMKTFQTLEPAQRNRLLFCLVSAFGFQFVSKAMQCDANILEESLLPMMCAMELKSLGFPYSSALFKKCDKAELVGKILSTKINCPKAVVFCVRLCMEFNIWDAQLWEAILVRFSSKPSDFSVQDILESVQGYLVHMWSHESFIAAWKVAIDSTFKKKYVDDSQFLTTIFKTLLRCPCVHELNVQGLVAEISAKCIEPGLKESLVSEDMCSLISILKIHAENAMKLPYDVKEHINVNEN